MVDIIKIYVLKEPDTLKVRYVGMTTKTLKQRWEKHLANAIYTKHNKHLCNWILKYYNKNQIPIIEMIEECTIENWQEREKYWIKNFNNLLNLTEGGEGSFGFKHTQETINLLRKQKIGQIQSIETRLKRSKSLKNRVINQEHRNKIGNANRNKIMTKYKIKIIDTITTLEYILNSIKEVKNFLKCGSKSTVYRNLDTNKLFRNRFFIIKI